MVAVERGRKASRTAPFVKWAGGKRQLLRELLAGLPRDIADRRYHEPFLGAGALYFALGPRHAILADNQCQLIETYQVVRDEVEPLVASLGNLEKHIGAPSYYALRERWNQDRAALSAVERAALFIYLNKRGFNGLYRVNSAGAFNVPVGTNVSRNLYDPDLLRSDARLLGRAQIFASPFETVLDRATSGDFVYFDPPYAPVSKTAHFTRYTKEGFGPNDQERLADVVVELDRRGCLVMLSNAETESVRRLYRRYRIDQVYATRAINSDAKKRGKIPEVLVRNYA